MASIKLRLGAVVTPLLLVLAACAQKPPEEHPTIIWDSDRTAPTSSQSVTPGAAVPRASSAAPSDACREYTQTVTIAGKEQQAYGRVCPQPDGSWRFEPPVQPPQSSRPAPPLTTSEAYPPVYPSTGGSVFFGSGVFFGHGHRHGYPHYW